MPGRPESGGPSEEELRIRTEVGEPEGRVKDIDEAERRANLSNPVRERAKELDQTAREIQEQADASRVRGDRESANDEDYDARLTRASVALENRRAEEIEDGRIK